ncbi:motility associated factor glycosyltransferase family protein [Desulfitobacterium sp.]|uniref:motility associated factor glycosyltransferase family protein n=1 Tax=Desulfitobacterium sp. TaxID=49981 RepID=UPI002B8EDA99|nr:6-hydroxymethylpterin diphosphokinase MptE-like protein [Desulfitobacterium sp.]HVJ50750.1 6-hydroxymethylpterin diphosphokinase MptE-like protein [Desulfitobacterium sp.]
MTFFEENLAFLLSQGFEEQILNQPLENSTVRLFTGKMGYYTAVKQVEDHDILLHSAYDPLNEASRLLAVEDISSYLSIFVFGLGLGYHLLELIEQTSQDCLIFVLESDWDIVRAAMHVIDFREILKTGRVVLAFGTPSDVRVILDGLFVNGEIQLKLHKMGFLYFAPKYRHDITVVQEIRRIIIEVFQYHILAKGNDISWSIKGLTNLSEHIPYLARSPYLRQIADTWHKPVVIVLAGPSLNKNIAVLKEWQDRVTIFCVNTVFNKLLDYGIVPDATFTLDRAPVIAEKHYKRDDHIPESVVLVGNPVIDPRSVNLFKHNMFIFGGGEFYQSELARDMGYGLLPVGLSVTHFAFMFALYIGAPAILLVGQDLAYGSEGRTHSSGSVYDEIKVDLDKENDVVYLEGYYGGEVPSSLSWKLFRDWYEIYLERFPSLLINCTEGGAKIKGTLQLPLKEALEQYVGTDSLKKDSFVDWLYSVKQDIKYEEMLDKIRMSFEKRIEKLQICELVFARASRVYHNIEDPEILLKFKKRYLDQMDKEARNIMSDQWIFSAFKPEYIRVMVEYNGLDTGVYNADVDLETVIISKAKLLQDMFCNIGLLSEKLRKILEDTVSKLNEKIGSSGSGKNSDKKVSR